MTLDHGTWLTVRLVPIIAAISYAPKCAALAALNENQNRHLMLKHEGRFRRIEYLESVLVDNGNNDMNSTTLNAMKRELQGLISKGDPYKAKWFAGTDHSTFKAEHNQAFVTLALYSAAATAAASYNFMNSSSTNQNPSDYPFDGHRNRPVFYLDGDDGASTTALLQGGFGREELFVANEWEDTVQALTSAPHFLTHCSCGKAEIALQDWHDYAFVAAYLDGCGGETAPIIDMITQLLQGNVAPSMAIGFTLTNADPLGRELVDRIQDVTRATLAMSRSKGYSRMDYVGDDPTKFGVSEDLPRKHQGTTTCWLYLMQ